MAAALLASSLLAGCARTTSFNLATQREESAYVTTDKEVALGRKLAKQVEKHEDVLLDEPIQERVRGIGERLAVFAERQELAYHFTVLEEDEVNAFSLPGGYVFVNEGLVDKAESDDELASVLAHELAHVSARHSMKRYEGSMAAQLLQLASLAAARNVSAAAGLGVAMRSAQLSYARQDELEADRLAIGYLKRAGYDPAALLTFLTRIREVERDKLRYLPRGVTQPLYGRTHPFVGDRIRGAKEAIYGVADYLDYLNSPE